MRALIDGRHQKHKPSGSEAGAITSRLKKAEPVDMTESEFCTAMRNGQTWVGGLYEEWGNADTFIGQQLYALDFDNAVHDLETGRKRSLSMGEAGHISPAQAIQRAQENDLQPLCLYHTLSSTHENVRFRLVFDMGEFITSYEKAQQIICALLWLYPEADEACKNPNRLFYGSNGEVVEVWRGDRP